MSWLAQEGPKAPKHAGFLHPLATFVVHYACVAVGTILAHDVLVEAYKKYYYAEEYVDDECSLVPSPPYRRNVAQFLTIYYICFLSWRLAIHRNNELSSPFDLYCEFYRQTFLCSVTLFNAAVGLYTDRPIIATAFCVAVGIDQLLWYVDLTVYFLCGRFPLGITKYLFWPGTTWVSRVSSTHHLWTIPLVLWASDGMHLISLPLSGFVVVSNVLLSRWMTPHSIAVGKEIKYLNINMAHELWTDIKMKFLLVYEDRFPYLVRLFVIWFTFNSIVFGLLFFASEKLLGPAPLC